MTHAPAPARSSDLFDPAMEMPQGFEFRPELISELEEAELLPHLARLAYEPFRFHGYEGKRRVHYFGWRYDFDVARIDQAEPIPDFLLPLRERAAEFARLSPASLAHVLVTQYPQGAPIGWHRDRPQFAETVGVSLVSSTNFRMRRRRGVGWERRAMILPPRSAYVLRGPARHEWEHSIPPAPSLRYSITFRSLADRA